jgi:hypothetical protein
VVNLGDGNADVSGIDGGFSNYLRQFYNMQVITTDEAVLVGMMMVICQIP